MATMNVTIPARTATPRPIVESLERGFDRRADSITTSPGYRGSRQTLLRMAALPSVNASTYSATAGRQVVVVGWPAAAAAPSWATRSSALSWPVVISAAMPVASMTIFGVLGGLAAELPNSSTNGGEQFRADHGEADVRQLVVLGVLGDGVVGRCRSRR